MLGYLDILGNAYKVRSIKDMNRDSQRLISLATCRFAAGNCKEREMKYSYLVSVVGLVSEIPALAKYNVI